MRKIKITPTLKAEVKSFNDSLFLSRKPDFELPISRLNKLRIKLKGNKNVRYRKYVELIIEEYNEILNADPPKMRSLISEFNKIVNSNDISLPYPKNKLHYFYKDVVFALRYEDLRHKEFPQYLMQSNLRTCIYCNSQSAIVLEKQYFDKKKRRVKKLSAKLQLDHFYPKSKYPFLATSFFNLYPTCSNCNQAKLDKEALFELYTYSSNLDVFKFKIDDASVLKYWMSLNNQNLRIKIDNIYSKDKMLLENHNELFQVQAVYDRQIDFGEELVWKAKVNPKIYRETIYKMFNTLFPDKTYIDRAIIGNYTKPDETFKRPMAKYTQDIARQLKLIK